MSVKSCIKCGHGASYEGEAPTSCPKCGVIYSKVEQAMAARVEAAPRPVDRADGALDVGAFAYEMRGESLYPVFRTIVGFATLVGYLLAGIVGVSSLIAGRGSDWVGLIGVCIAILIAIFAKAGKEISLMLADLADAAVRLAARSDTQR